MGADGTLKIKEWRKFTKYLFYQIVVAVQWMHNIMNCCHLDISLENITVQNGDFIMNVNGFYSINPEIMLKFIDFGLAEFFDPNEEFECVKYCGKTAYKAPEIYNEENVFNAQKADIWSLGVVLFCMAIGSPPYVEPSEDDDTFKYYIRNGYIEQLLFQWNKHCLVTVKMVDLMKKMLNVDVKSRYLIEDCLKHSWMSSYYKQYQSQYNEQMNGLEEEYEDVQNHYVSLYKLPVNV